MINHPPTLKAVSAIDAAMHAPGSVIHMWTTQGCEPGFVSIGVGEPHGWEVEEVITVSIEEVESTLAELSA